MVLNNKGKENGINEDTQKRVWAKARELDYRPNIMARSLRTGRSYTIGLIVADISNVFTARMCRSVEDAASKKGYYCLFSSSDGKVDREKELIQMLRGRLVDGIILSTTLENNEDILQLKKDDFPLVLIDRYIPNEAFPFVTADNYGGSKAAVGHLIRKGKKRIALLRTSPSHLASMTERERGYRSALKSSGIPYDGSINIEIPYNAIKSAIEQIIPPLLSGPDPVEALYTLDHNLAIAALNCLSMIGKSIPDDVALLSFGDSDLFGIVRPGITAVAQPIEEMGTRAVEIILDRIERGDNGGLKDQIHLPTTLIDRGSCS